MGNPFISRFINIFLCSKWNSVEFFFRALINYGTHFSTKRHSVRIGFDKILVYLGTNAFEQVSKAAQHRKISSNRMLCLVHVSYSNDNYGSQRNIEHNKCWRIEVQRIHSDCANQTRYDKKFSHFILRQCSSDPHRRGRFGRTGMCLFGFSNSKYIHRLLCYKKQSRVCSL